MGDRARVTVDRFRLGYVKDPLPGHERYQGMLAIPYVRRSLTGDWAVVSLRFRCLEDHEHKKKSGCYGKYMTQPGDTPRLFNTVALLTSQPKVVLCEGELDAVTATVCGVPAVAVSGANVWQPHYREMFEGFEATYVMTDGDEAGQELGKKAAKELSNAVVVPCPDGQDLTEYVIEHGSRALKERIGM